MHEGFRAWLKLQGVDSPQVSFIEAAFLQHGDLLRGSSLDAVVTARPFMALRRRVFALLLRRKKRCHGSLQ